MFEPRSHVLYFRKENGKTVSYDPGSSDLKTKLKVSVSETPSGLHSCRERTSSSRFKLAGCFYGSMERSYNDPSAHHYYVGTPKQTLERKIAELQAKIAELSNPSAADLDAAAAEESAKLLTEKPSLVKAKARSNPSCPP